MLMYPSEQWKMLLALILLAPQSSRVTHETIHVTSTAIPPSDCGVMSQTLSCQEEPMSLIAPSDCYESNRTQ